MKFRTSASQRLLTNIKRKLKLLPLGPPFHFPVQVGDPVLRMRAREVTVEHFKSKELERVLSAMHFVLGRTRAVGISAPQIGVSFRIFMTELTARECEFFRPEYGPSAELKPWPFKVFINPTCEVNDNSTSMRTEGCVSVFGFVASVPRFDSVTVKGLDENGETVSWRATGLAARVVQHEMDHLDGTLYIDRMNSKTFQYCDWKGLQQKQEEVEQLSK